jgi:endonuclease/exonuclease/phosphatase family metal-dependent hydrolase
MRLLTLNIWNYTRPWPERCALIVDLIARTNPDVVCLQEVRHDFRFARGRSQAAQIAESLGMHVTEATAQVYWPFPRVDEGLAILTREPPQQIVRADLPGLPDERADENHRICLGVSIPAKRQPFTVFNTHFSLGPRARLLNAAECLRLMHTATPISFLFGDLNCRPESEPIRFLLGDHEVQGERGDLSDLWQLAGVGPGNTYAAWGPYERIDYALARGLDERLVDVRVVGNEATGTLYPSDHLGIVVDVDL